MGIAMGRPKYEESYLGASSNSASPFLISGGGKERGERGKEGGILFPLFPFLLPFSFLHLGRPRWGAHQPLVAGVFLLGNVVIQKISYDHARSI